MKASLIIIILFGLVSFSCRPSDPAAGGAARSKPVSPVAFINEIVDPSAVCSVSYSDDGSGGEATTFRPQVGYGSSQIRGRGKYYQNKWNDKWSDMIYKKLDAPHNKFIMNKKIDKDELKLVGCPRYNEMNRENRKKFWTIFFATNIQGEGGHDPDSFYKENGSADSYGLNQVDSRGCNAHARLIGYQGPKYQPTSRSKGYGMGGDMYNPEKNIECGLIIMSNQMRKGLGLFTSDKDPSGQRTYWATMRYKRNAHKKFKNRINKYITQIPACKEAPTNPKYGEKNLVLNKAGADCNSVADQERDIDGKDIVITGADVKRPPISKSTAITK